MANKTPYEVRLDVLKMAQEMLNKEASINQDTFHIKYEQFRELNPNNTSAGAVNSFIEKNAPKMYDASDVITRATSLYDFIRDTR